MSVLVKAAHSGPRRIESGAMPRVRSLVKPTRPPFLWKLGVVEKVLDDGRYFVRSYVAPPKSYEGSAAPYAPDEVAEIPRARVEARLNSIRMQIEQLQETERQVVAALAATADAEG